MHTLFRIAAVAATVAAASQAMATVTFHEREGYGGRTFTASRSVADLQRSVFNDRASSALVTGERWEVCEDTWFGGRCAILRPRRYPSLSAMGLNNRVSSVREISSSARMDERRYAPAAAPFYDAHRRHQEKVFEADVTSVRAVVGAPERRCWIGQDQGAQKQSRTNVPAAVIGAVIGGILGHQVGGGLGKDLASIGGVVAGGAVGATVGRDGQAQPAATRDVQRCETQASTDKPEFWDVTYAFEGQEPQLHMTTPPGRTVTVSRNGEPRT